MRQNIFTVTRIGEESAYVRIDRGKFSASHCKLRGKHVCGVGFGPYHLSVIAFLGEWPNSPTVYREYGFRLFGYALIISTGFLNGKFDASAVAYPDRRPQGRFYWANKSDVIPKWQSRDEWPDVLLEDVLDSGEIG